MKDIPETTIDHVQAFSCAKRAADPSNEFSACLKWCGNSASCPCSASAPADGAIAQLTALIRKLLNSRDAKVQALAESLQKVRAEFESTPAQATPSLPSTPDEVIAFIGSNFDSSHTQGDKADWRYQVSVHDLLSAFSEWQDFPVAQATPEGGQELPPLPEPDGSDEGDGRMEAIKYWLADSMRDYARAALAATQQAAEPDKRPLFERKLADLQKRGYEVIGRILHKNGEYALFDSSCRWLTQPQYWRLMHEQDGSLFADRAAPPQQVGESGLPG
jgi:hypothetical protein